MCVSRASCSARTRVVSSTCSRTGCSSSSPAWPTLIAVIILAHRLARRRRRPRSSAGSSVLALVAVLVLGSSDASSRWRSTYFVDHQRPGHLPRRACSAKTRHADPPRAGEQRELRAEHHRADGRRRRPRSSSPAARTASSAFTDVRHPDKVQNMHPRRRSRRTPPASARRPARCRSARGAASRGVHARRRLRPTWPASSSGSKGCCSGARSRGRSSRPRSASLLGE